jgi:hypothetical protein
LLTWICRTPCGCQRDLAGRAFQQLETQLSFQLLDTAVLIGLVAAGLGVSIYPKSLVGLSARAFPSGRSTIRGFAGDDPCVETQAAGRFGISDGATTVQRCPIPTICQ